MNCLKYVNVNLEQSGGRNSFSEGCPVLVILLSFPIERTTKEAIDNLFLKDTSSQKRNSEMIAISKSNQHARVSNHINKHTQQAIYSDTHMLVLQKIVKKMELPNKIRLDIYLFIYFWLNLTRWEIICCKCYYS